MIDAAVFLAGYLAEKMVEPYTDINTAGADLEAVARLLPAGADLRDLVIKVERRLKSSWDSVERVAAALDREGTIRGADRIRDIGALPADFLDKIVEECQRRARERC